MRRLQSVDGFETIGVSEYLEDRRGVSVGELASVVAVVPSGVEFVLPVAVVGGVPLNESGFDFLGRRHVLDRLSELMFAAETRGLNRVDQVVGEVALLAALTVWPDLKFAVD